LVREDRLASIEQPHVAPLTTFVRQLRAEMGPTHAIPYFDPLDGGTHASILFLLEAPGPRAIETGFVSRNNPDETAKNFYLLNQEVGIDRKLTVTWNVVPWYIGSGTKVRPAKSRDVSAGASSLDRLLELLPHVRTIVLLGGAAARARGIIESLRPSAHVVEMPHPSPMFVNRSPGNRDRLLGLLRNVASSVRGAAPPQA
jgi:uracil-DNA glycosylase